MTVLTQCCEELVSHLRSTETTHKALGWWIWVKLGILSPITGMMTLVPLHHMVFECERLVTVFQLVCFGSFRCQYSAVTVLPSLIHHKPVVLRQEYMHGPFCIHKLKVKLSALLTEFPCWRTRSVSRDILSRLCKNKATQDLWVCARNILAYPIL